MKGSIRPKTWIELSKSAVRSNVALVRSLIGKDAKLFSVVKSNAYGHGLTNFAALAHAAGVDGFCVDSVIEGVKLRKQEIQSPILILGPTSKDLLEVAAQNDLMVTISTQEGLEELNQVSEPQLQPSFHLKIETGMHRQGFEVADLKKALRYIKKNTLPLKGMYSHFCAAKDIVYQTYTKQQFDTFMLATTLAESEEFRTLTKHIAASAGIFQSKKYTLDQVRAGFILYGYFPTKELATHFSNLEPKPVLSWHAQISEIKKVKKGEYVGYDLSEKLHRDTTLAVVPVGYWHGVDRRLSKVGEFLVNGKRARIVGKVSMDVTVVDVTDISCKRGDVVTLIGKQGKEKITPEEWELNMENSSRYEILTRINPLIKKEFVQ
ncbi:MAG: alanine racemase [Candidatus Paceibacterota bacterium]